MSHIGNQGPNGKIFNADRGINRLLFKRLCSIFCVLFPSIRSPTVFAFVVFMVASFIAEILNFYAGHVPSKFIKIVVEGKNDEYKCEFCKAFVIIILTAVFKSTKKYLRCYLETMWRKTMCQEMHKKYFRSMNYYHLNTTKNYIDNPDHRMSNDVSTMVHAMGKVFADVLLGPFMIAYYSYVVYMTVGIGGFTITYTLIFTFLAVNIKTLSAIVQTKEELDKSEGNYRFQQMHVRVYAESIALQSSENAERALSNQRLDSVIGASLKSFWAQYIAFTSLYLFWFTKELLSLAVFAFPYFGGQFDDLSPAELGQKICENNFVIGHLIYMYADFLDNTKEISEVAGTTHRVAEFMEALEGMDVVNLDGDRMDDQMTENRSRGCLYEIKGMSLYPPERCGTTKPMINDLTLKICYGDRILICGRGNCGKTSILRILKGLWPADKSVWRSDFVQDSSNVFYLPQKPLLTVGSLRNQLIYPNKKPWPGMCSDSQVLRYLKELKLDHLVQRTGGLDEDVDWNWYDVLSPSEAHRIGIVRLFNHRPKVVFLDDVLGTLDPLIVSYIYEQFVDLCMTVVTVGDEITLSKYHSQVVQLKTDGSWNFRLNAI